MANLGLNIFVFVMALIFTFVMLSLGLSMFEETRLGEYVIYKIIERWNR